MADRVNEAAIDSSFTAAQDGPAITKEVSVIAARRAARSLSRAALTGMG